MVSMPEETRVTLRMPTDLADFLRERSAATHRSLNSEIVHLLRQVQFPDIDADAYRGTRGTLGAMPRYTLPRPFGRRPRGGG
jgi:hypothetical protein